MWLWFGQIHSHLTHFAGVITWDLIFWGDQTSSKYMVSLREFTCSGPGCLIALQIYYLLPSEQNDKVKISPQKTCFGWFLAFIFLKSMLVSWPPCDFDDSGVLHRSSFRIAKYMKILGDPFIATQLQGSLYYQPKLHALVSDIRERKIDYP